MHTFTKTILCLSLAAAFIAPVAIAPSLPLLDGPSMAHAAKKKSSSSKKTQSVSSHTKKNGTKVKGYKRTPPR